MPASIVDGVAVLHVERRTPAVRGRLERSERMVREARGAAGLVGVAERLRDRVPGAVADLEQPLARGAAAARKPVAAVLARERAAELLQPVDRGLRVAGRGVSTSRGFAVSCDERITSSACSSGESSSPKAAWIPPWAFDGVVGLDRALGRERDPGSCPLGGDGSREPGGAAADHEHVESGLGLHPVQGYQVSLFVALAESYLSGRTDRERGLLSLGYQVALSVALACLIAEWRTVPGHACDRIAPCPRSPM